MEATGTLEARLAEVSGQLNVLHGRLVDLVVEAIDTNAWTGVGIRSLPHWLGWKAGVSPATAHELVALAEARATHPAVSQLLTDGAVTIDQAVAAITAPPHCDEVMAHLAPMSTVRQIRSRSAGGTVHARPGTGTRAR